MSRAESKKTAQAATLPSRLRIVGGRWRGMRIDFPPIEAIRPTPDRVRETLFNWLQEHILGAACLDLFAGSGALGIEALSRGALHVTFVDREPRIVKHLNATLARLQAMNAEVVTSDALLYLKGPPRRFDTVFLDPPFASDVLPQVFTLLAGGWLAPGAHIYVECAARSPLPALPPGWSLYRSKRAGEVGYHLLQAVTEAVEDAP
jgi:16S rRNA (guanine966-N2)-methyltransferase